jgi:hypothetical protein
MGDKTYHFSSIGNCGDSLQSARFALRVFGQLHHVVSDLSDKSHLNDAGLTENILEDGLPFPSGTVLPFSRIGSSPSVLTSGAARSSATVFTRS